jgi:hypothetical protein
MKFEKKESNFDSSLSLSQRTPKEKKKSTVDAINRS